MKYIKLKVEPELHKEIKIKAAEAGKSMHQYILDCIKYPPKTVTVKDAEEQNWNLDYMEIKEDSCKHEWRDKEDCEHETPAGAFCDDCPKPKKKTKSVMRPSLKEYGKQTPVDHTITSTPALCQKCLYPAKAVEHTCK